MPQPVFSMVQKLVSSPWLSGPRAQPFWELLHRTSLFGMNLGGGSEFATSGEVWVVEQVVKPLGRPDRDLVVFDVGANEGSYTEMLRAKLGPSAWIYSFEPSPKNLERLRGKVAGDARVRVEAMGLSDEEGTATLYGEDQGTVVGTLHPGYSIDHKPIHAVEECAIGTVDSFCERTGIDRIDLLKLDIEGHEYQALQGAKRMLDQQAIQVIQFEFGVAQINARHFFRDLFMLLQPSYRIHRVLRNGLFPIDHYDECREVYRTSNYLAIRRS